MPSSNAQRHPGDGLDLKGTLDLLTGAAVLDRAVRQSVQHCWIMLPPEKRSATAVAAEMHRILDRALYDFERDLNGSDGAPKFE